MVSAGVVLLLLPEPAKVALVPRDGWRVQRGFVQGVLPGPGEVSRSILESPEATFWRSWRPGAGPQPGSAATVPFAPPSVLAVPIAGYPDRPGLDLVVECVATEARRPLARGNAHETWVERTIWLGRWCPSDVRVIARSSSRADYLAVGTPFRSSWLSYMKESVFVLAAIHALAWLVLLVTGLGPVLLLGIREPGTALLASIPATLAAGYAAFFAVYLLGALGVAVVVLGLATSALVVAWKVGRDRAAWSRLRSAPVGRALLLCFVVSLAYVLLVYAGQMGIGGWTTAYRFAPATWSSDAQLPQIVAEGLYRRQEVATMIGGGWHVSDRPPLLSGLFLLARPLWAPLLALGDNHRLAFLFYQVTGMVACTLWVIPAWMLLDRVLGPAHAARGVGLLAATSVVLFNSVYVWPKMLAGALGLAAFLVLSNAMADSDARTDDPSRRPWRSYAMAGALAGLAFVTHGGVAFGLLPVLLLPLLKPTRPRLAGLVVAGLVGLAVILPWMIWQRAVDPPGNALIKFALAGTYGTQEPTKGVWATVRDAHAGLTISGWLGMRWNAVLTLFGRYTPPLISWYWKQPADFLGRRREADFLHLLPGLRAMNLGWLALVLLPFQASSPATAAAGRAARAWLALGVGGIAVGTLVNFDFNTTHCHSYLSILLLLLGLYAALSQGPRWLYLSAVALQVIYLTVVWIGPPLATLELRLDTLFGFLLVIICLIVITSRTGSAC